ncbi:MAG: Xaa-Pro aminopeptidase [Pseudomonadota bacterium]
MKARPPQDATTNAQALRPGQARANFAKRRARLCERMQPGAVAIVATAPEVPRNGDSDYPYRHDSGFYYLSGFAEPDSVLVLLAARASAPARSVLFCRQKNAEREIWDGFRHGPDGAREAFGFDEAYPIEELDGEMVKLLADAPAVYYALASSGALDLQMKTWMAGVRRQSRSGVAAPGQAHDICVLLDEMRLFKDDTELALMQRAADISGAAHARAMRASRAGMFEYEIEAELLYEFRRHGAQYPAYTPIVATGANACVLHYVANSAQSRDGDLILIDAGCEFDGYASDITRSYPVNGRFSPAQKALYELVLAAQDAALAAVQPGRRYSDIHDAAVKVLAQGMLDLGLLDKEKCGSVDDVIAERAFLQFYMHGTGHWLGMDVHDVGAYRESATEGKPSRALEAGMVLTVEPGIYVRPAAGVPEQFWNIGIRIEDDVFVHADGHRVLSGAAPKLVADIEHLMRPA